MSDQSGEQPSGQASRDTTEPQHKTLPMSAPLGVALVTLAVLLRPDLNDVVRFGVALPIFSIAVVTAASSWWIRRQQQRAT